MLSRDRTVWVIETLGWPEERMVWGVAVSPQAGAEAIKAAYGPPYRVAWEELKADAEGSTWELWGEFEGVPGYSTRHRGGWVLTEWQVSQDA